MSEPKRVLNFLKREDGTPWPHNTTLGYVVDRIADASAAGSGLSLSAEQVRALDWAIIRENGGYDTDRFRDGSYFEIGEPTCD